MNRKLEEARRQRKRYVRVRQMIDKILRPDMDRETLLESLDTLFPQHARELRDKYPGMPSDDIHSSLGDLLLLAIKRAEK